MTEEILQESSGCIPKVVDSWRSLFSTFSVEHRIYPSDPNVPKDCEFIIINSKIRIRVIHIYPGSINESPLPQPTINDPSTISKRSSLSEEYWFTKWNKPLKFGNCNCSFRRSKRYSLVLNQPVVQNTKRESVLSIDLPPLKITNVETLVERLIQDTFFEAFREYYILRTKNEDGKINLAYETTEEDDIIVTLRKKLKPNIKESETVKLEANSSNFLRTSAVDNSKRKSCGHKKIQKKPLIILQHGIGSSAEVWSILINAFVQRGFEVVAPDMLGHGLSSAPDKSKYYTFSNLLLQALTIFDHYMTDDERKCILIGHSYGLVTAIYPHRARQIAQLILISGGGPTPLAPPVKENEISPFGCVYNLLHPLLYCGLKRSFFYSLRGKNFGPCYNENGLLHYVFKYIVDGQKWTDGDAAFHRRIRVPTLLVHGLQDKNITLVQECEMERTIPRAFLELIPNSGHMPMLETPEHLIHMIMCFVDMWS